MQINIKPLAQTIKKQALSKVEDGLALVSKRAQYKQFKKRIAKEINPRISAEEEKINKQLNPINVKNIQAIKNDILDIIVNLNTRVKVSEKIKEKIVATSNPQELFLLLKTEFCQHIMPKQTLFHILFSSKKQKFRQENLMDYIKVLTPKSTTSEVLQLEEEVKKLGIKKVNFGDDYDYAQIAKQTIEEKIKVISNFQLPSSLTVSPALPNWLKGMHSKSKTGEKEIYLAPFANFMLMKNLNSKKILWVKENEFFKAASPEKQRKLLDELKLPSASTNSDGHIILHEFSHEYAGFKLLTPKEVKIAKQVSKVASQKTFGVNFGHEAATELLAKQLNGAILSKDEAELLLKTLYK